MNLNFCREWKVACCLILPKAIRHTTQGQIQTIQKEVARTLASCILHTIYFTENSLKMIENFTEYGVGTAVPRPTSTHGTIGTPLVYKSYIISRWSTCNKMSDLDLWCSQKNYELKEGRSEQVTQKISYRCHNQRELHQLQLHQLLLPGK